MTKRWALIVGTRVSTVVVQPEAPALVGRWVECAGRFGPGDVFDGAAFSKRPEAVARRITPGALRDRFTPAETARIELAALDDPTMTQPDRLAAAGLRARMRRLDGAEYVDLDDQQRTRAPLHDLEQRGLLDAPGRALQILDAPIVNAERPGA